MKTTNHKSIFIILFLFFISSLNAQTKNNYSSLIDSLLLSNPAKPFNGVVLIKQNGQTTYQKVSGLADIGNNKPLEIDNQFVIGSISKQITAVMVMQAYEQGLLKLNIPIHNYLPKLIMPWADTITVHDLLTHTHGISALNKPLLFKPGARFQYSQLGYQLLAEILETVTNKSFIELSSELFTKCDMRNSFHPDNKTYKNLVNGYEENEKGILVFIEDTFENYAPAGAFISTADDMVKWNTSLYNGKLLNDTTFQLMCKKYATREHPIFNKIDYGYGLTFKNNENNKMIGALGYAPGFVSANFYFPKTKTSVVIFENTARELSDLKKTFYYHLEILDIVRQCIDL